MQIVVTDLAIWLLLGGEVSSQWSLLTLSHHVSYQEHTVQV